jgi:phosphoribosylanthranilate isomerase
MVKVKICGITNLEDARAAIDAGCDALGFVFYRKSPRYIAPQRVKEIIRNLPKAIIKIGVFVNAKEKTIKNIAKLCNLDILQFHGDESPNFCKKFGDYRVIKVFRIKDKVDLQDILRYKTFAYLFDTFVKDKFGGSGKKFNWGLLKYVDEIKQPVFISGGLNASNVKEAIKSVHPEWVDVSTSVEASPGKKDSRKVREFIRTARDN